MTGVLCNTVMDFVLDEGHKGENIIFTGLTGTGKSYLAQAIGSRACEMLHRTFYFSMSRFTDDAAANKIQGNYTKWLKKRIHVSNYVLNLLGRNFSKSCMLAWYPCEQLRIEFTR